MDLTEQINCLYSFFETFHRTEILEAIRQYTNNLLVDFEELAKFSPELAEELLDQPDETYKKIEIAINRFDDRNKEEPFFIRLYNLPKSCYVVLGNIRTKHIGKIIFTEGTIREATEVYSRVTKAEFECPTCTNKISIRQLDIKFREPTRCGCGRKGKFKLVSKSMIDEQKLLLEETEESLTDRSRPGSIEVILSHDLTRLDYQKYYNVGSKIKLVGFIEEVPIPNKNGGTSTRFNKIFAVNNIIFQTEKEKQQIKEGSLVSNEFKSPDLIIKIHDELNKYHVLDHKEKVGVFLISASGDLKKPEEHQSAALKGDSSAGKDNIIKTVFMQFPEHDNFFLTRATRSTVEEEVSKVKRIAFSEINAHRENGANSDLVETFKQLSEGGVNVMKKDPSTGFKTTIRIKSEQKSLLYGTTETAVDNELITRYIVIPVTGYAAKNQSVVNHTLKKSANEVQ